MPENAGKTENIDVIQKLIDMGVPENYMENAITAGIILGDAIDFIKKLGALSEFTETLPVPYRIFLFALFEIRPKELGGNPFE